MNIAFHDDIKPEFLYELMRKQRLLPDAYAKDPTLILNLVDRATTVSLSEGEELLGLVLGVKHTPEALNLMVFIINKSLPWADLAGVQEQLRERWFEGAISRVQAIFPVSRKNTRKFLAHLGFIEETRGCGLRNTFNYGDHHEACTVMSLLPSDPIKTFHVERSVAHAS